MAFEPVAAIDVDPLEGRIYEHGWQSWSPTTTYAVTERPFRPTGPVAAPPDPDWSQPSTRAASLSGVGRAFQHGRFWVNDPDCLIVGPAVEAREDWARHVARHGGLRSSSDRLIDLDEWGLATTRAILSDQPPTTFVSAG